MGNQPGYVPFNNMQPPQQQKLPGDTMAIVSMVLSIIGVTCCTGSFLLSVLGIIFGFIARSKGTTKDGMALAGIILGFIGLVVGVIFIVVMAASGAWEDMFYSYSYNYF